VKLSNFVDPDNKTFLDPDNKTFLDPDNKTLVGELSGETIQTLLTPITQS